MSSNSPTKSMEISKGHLYALVQWIDEEDYEAYTANVPMEWIGNFTGQLDECDDRSTDKTLKIVEWRQTMEKKGWKYYPCHIINVSDETDYLEFQLQKIEGRISTKRIVENGIVVPALDESVVHRWFRSKENKNIQSPNKKSHPTNVSLSLASSIKMDATLSKRNKETKKRRQSTSDEDMPVEIGSTNSGITIPKKYWDEVDAQTSCRQMTLVLLRALFPLDVLVNSYHKKTPKNHCGSLMKPLDDGKMAALKLEVFKKFPETYKEAHVLQTITDELSNLRKSNFYLSELESDIIRKKKNKIILKKKYFWESSV